MKFFIAKCSDGWLTLSYTGLGRINGISGTDTGEWLVSKLRGIRGDVQEVLAAIVQHSSSEVGPQVRGWSAHTFIGGGFKDESPFFVRISNVTSDEHWTPADAKATFSLELEDVSEGRYYIAGQHPAVRPKDVALLARLANRKPRSPSDFRKLLASINRRAAVKRFYSRRLSASCTTSFMPPEGMPIEQQDYWLGTVPKKTLVATPLILEGFDINLLGEIVLANANELSGDDPVAQAAAIKKVVDGIEESKWNIEGE